MTDNFISAYLTYCEGTESPVTFNRWACLGALGAWLGPRFTFQLGHQKIKPNLFLMLMGSPGTRKSTSIKLAAGLIRKAGYTNIAADRTTKEKFLLDLAGEDIALKNEDILDMNLFGSQSDSPAEILVAADEFNSFAGTGNMEFLSLLGTLWDYTDTYKNRVKNSKSVEIIDPTVSILGGNTPTGFSLAFPSDSIGQGIFSRILLIHGEPSGRKITFPRQPSAEETKYIIDKLLQIKITCLGAMEVPATSEKLLDKIYKNWESIGDVRFESYSNRRFTHLLKLSLIVCAARCATVLEEGDVIYANTILTHAEHQMPNALGAFGKAKNSDISHKLLQILSSSHRALTLQEVWKHLHTDLEKMSDLADMLRNLVAAERIMQHSSNFLIKRQIIEESSGDGTLDYSMLTDEERSFTAAPTSSICSTDL